MGLYTLEKRWLQGDMIEMFKIMKGIDKISAEELFSIIDRNSQGTVIGTRGHSLRVKQMRVYMLIQQGPFSHRVVNAWNGLARKVVAAEMMDSFSMRLNVVYKKGLNWNWIRTYKHCR